MAMEPSLLPFIEDMDVPGLLKALDEIQSEQGPVPLDDIVSILHDTDDVTIVAPLVDVLIARLPDIDDDIMNGVYPRASDVVKRHMITVLSYRMSSKAMQFLLEEYFYNPYMRPSIRQQAFGDKRLLFMNLVRYVEGIPFNEDNVQVAQQLLRTIPEAAILSFAGLFDGSVLLDVYYAMPLEDRAEG
tara:strand:- start:912 stop:1472 length:561 start_codon:yes stop_codon:yes gene_type:complete